MSNKRYKSVPIPEKEKLGILQIMFKNYFESDGQKKTGWDEAANEGGGGGDSIGIKAGHT